VKGLVSKKHRHTFDKLLEEFNRIGYTVSWKVLNAWDYGVAQKRERFFIVGVRNDLGFSFVFPEPEPGDYRTKVLRDVIGDLPDPGVKLNGKQIAFLERNPVSVAKNRPVTMDEPSRTIPAVIHKGVPYGLFYYEVGMVPRRFTVRECLRIQSAPDWYVLPDDISLSAQYRIVGNGVPCRVAWYLGRALADQLKEVMQ